MKTAYPEFPFSPAPDHDLMSYEKAVKYLKSKYDVSTAKAVFAIMFAEASKNKEHTAFQSAGGHNYAGIQTDNSRWGAPGIIGQFALIDSGKANRLFAIFASDESFLDFMASRIKAKGFNGLDADNWTLNYINKWWSPVAKAEYVKGSEKYKEKCAIYNSAMAVYNKF